MNRNIVTYKEVKREAFRNFFKHYNRKNFKRIELLR